MSKKHDEEDEEMDLEEDDDYDEDENEAEEDNDYDEDEDENEAVDEDADEEALSVQEHDSILINMRWKVRLVIVLTLLVLGFIGIMISTFSPSGSWLYWRIISFVFAILCIWLAWYMRRNLLHKGRGWWYVLLHWVGTLIAVFMLDGFTSIGVLGSLSAGMVVLSIFGLSFFVAGIYLDVSYILVGITFFVFSFATAFFETYLPLITLPVVVVIALIAWFVVSRSRATLDT